MRRISFNKRFVNNGFDDLIPGKIHTIRKNYDFWKKYEGKDVALFTWEDKPYQKGSKQKVFCIKRIVSVQVIIWDGINIGVVGDAPHPIFNEVVAKNDGFDNKDKFYEWFKDYPHGMMAILHFTDFRY